AHRANSGTGDRAAQKVAHGSGKRYSPRFEHRVERRARAAHTKASIDHGIRKVARRAGGDRKYTWHHLSDVEAAVDIRCRRANLLRGVGGRRPPNHSPVNRLTRRGLDCARKRTAERAVPIRRAMKAGPGNGREINDLAGTAWPVALVER